MAPSDPLFELSFKRWPPIYRYKRQTGQKTLTAEVPTPAEATPDPSLANLTGEQQRHPPNPVAEQEQGNRPTTSSSEALSSLPLMNPYPITFPVPLPGLLPSMAPPLAPPFPPPFLNAFHGPPPSSSSSSGVLGDSFQQFGVSPNFPSNNFSLGNSFPSMTSIPAGFFSPINSFTPAMGGSINAAIRGDFPPLHSLPPSFWEPVIRQPEPDPTPPMHTPQAPSLQNLASRADGNGENFSDDSLKAIIIKAQPHHTHETLSHLTRAQLVKHVDDLVDWWKQANPQQANRVQQAHAQPIQTQQQFEQRPQTGSSTTQFRHEQSPSASLLPPLSAAVQAAAESAAASAKAQEKVIGQCPCCCEAQQNAAFSPCGHLYACTRCAHRVYDGGRGRCPVCRIPIQTYLKIYATG